MKRRESLGYLASLASLPMVDVRVGLKQKAHLDVNPLFTEKKKTVIPNVFLYPNVKKVYKFKMP